MNRGFATGAATGNSGGIVRPAQDFKPLRGPKVRRGGAVNQHFLAFIAESGSLNAKAEKNDSAKGMRAVDGLQSIGHAVPGDLGANSC